MDAAAADMEHPVGDIYIRPFLRPGPATAGVNDPERATSKDFHGVGRTVDNADCNKLARIIWYGLDVRGPLRRRAYYSAGYPAQLVCRVRVSDEDVAGVSLSCTS